MKKKEFQQKFLKIVQSITRTPLAVFRYSKNHPIKILLLASLLYWLVVPAASNYFGVCEPKGRRLKDEEKIRAEIERILSFKEIYREKKSHSKGDNYYKVVSPKMVDDFLKLHPDCCEVKAGADKARYHSHNSYALDLISFFFNRITGYNSTDIIRVQYEENYIDESGKKQTETMKYNSLQNNCGAFVIGVDGS